MWDNARFHRDEQLERKLKRRGVTRVRLPRYSPDYNPIELLWQKLKHYLKKARIDVLGQLSGGLVEAMKEVKLSDVEGGCRKRGFNVSTA